MPNNKKTIMFVLIFLLILVITIVLINSSKTFAETSTSNDLSLKEGVVSCVNLNMRLGPGLNFPVVYKIHKGDRVKIFEKIGDWYLVQNEKKCTGMVNASFIVNSVDSNSAGSNESVIVKMEKELLDMVNAERKKNGLKVLAVDATLAKAAKVKAKEMVTKKYFSHSSPTYGSPFVMMSKLGIKYKAAGENIAGAETVKEAFSAWMKAKSHKANIMNKNYNYTGIGVSTSETYGNIIVEQFVGR